MINKVQVLWGYCTIASVCRVFSELIVSILKLKPEMIGLTTVIFLVLFILKFKIKSMKESDYLFAFMIQDRRMIERS